MDKITKEMKSISKCMGLLGVLQIFELVTSINMVKTMDISVLNSFDYASLGIPVTTLLSIVKIMAIVPTILGILVCFYLCVKGIREASDPSSAKLHIVLGVIGLIIYALGTIELVSGLTKSFSVMGLLDALVAAATAVLLFFYCKYAKAIRVRE